MIPWRAISTDNIHFNYSLTDGTMMAMSMYKFSALRLIFDTELEECLSCDVKAFTDEAHKNCDYDFKAKFRFPNGGTGDAQRTLKGDTRELGQGS